MFEKVPSTGFGKKLERRFRVTSDIFFVDYNFLLQ